MSSFWIKLLVTITVLILYLTIPTYLEDGHVVSLNTLPLNDFQFTDGRHEGAYIYRNQTIYVSAIIKDWEISEIYVHENLKGEIYEKAAQSVILQIILTQQVDLPIDTNDTLSVQAYKKAFGFAVFNAVTGFPMLFSTRPAYDFIKSIFLVSFIAGCSSIIVQGVGHIAFQAAGLITVLKWVTAVEIAAFRVMVILLVLPFFILIVAKP